MSNLHRLPKWRDDPHIFVYFCYYGLMQSTHCVTEAGHSFRCWTCTTRECPPPPMLGSRDMFFGALDVFCADLLLLQRDVILCK